jgi:hypothetical protein
MTEFTPQDYREAADFLEKAKAIIADPKHWTQGAFARKENGTQSPTNVKEAVCWCTMGAIFKAAGIDADNYYVNVSETAYNLACKTMEYKTQRGIPNFNDTNNHEAVMGLFNQTIEDLREKA